MALPHDLRDETITDADTVMENLEYLEALLGNLTEANLAASTQIGNSKLANPVFNVVLTAQFTEAQLNDMTTTDGTKMLMIGAIPYDSGDTALSAWTVQTIETATFLNGGVPTVTAPIFKLQVGNPASGWADVTSATGITWGITNNTARVSPGTALSGANFATESYYLALRPTTAAATYDWTALMSAAISVKLKRALRA